MIEMINNGPETIRSILEHNDKRENPINPVLLVEAYLEDNGMCLTADDKVAMQEHDLLPHRFMQFSDAQLDRMNEIEQAVNGLMTLLLTKPDYLKHKDIEIPEFQQSINYYGLSMMEIADNIATTLADSGYTVFFPTHVREADGEERIDDIY